jgi:hypothetical protein
MYEETVALRDNPFGPRADKLAPRPELRFAMSLDKQPLRVDRCSALRPLYCSAISHLDAHEARFRALLASMNYDFADRSPGLENVIILLRGAQGVGKTTLASWFIDIVQKGFDPAAPLFEPDRSGPKSGPWTKEDLAKGLAAMKTQIASTTQPGDHLLMLVEDVMADTLDLVLGLYDDLGDYPKLMFATTHDLSLLDKPLQNMSQTIEAFTLAPIGPEDAEAFVRHRLELFRNPKIAGLDAVSPVFPWPLPRLLEEVQDMSAIAGDALTETSPITLRVLSTNLRRKLQEHHQQLEKQGVAPIGTAPPERLKDYLIV